VKKIYLFLMFIFTFIFFNISEVDAKSVTNVCYYKNSNSKLSFVVKTYDNGKSDIILTKPYSKAEFKEDQLYGATWKNLDVNVTSNTSENGCMEYMKYTIVTGSNKFAFYDDNSKISTSGNEHKLTNYDPSETFSSCTYKGHMSLNEEDQIKVNVLMDKDIVIVYYNDDITTIMNESITADDSKYKWANSFYNDFIDTFDDKTGCPGGMRDTADGSSTYIYTPVSENGSMWLVSEEYKGEHSDIEVKKPVASYTAPLFIEGLTKEIFAEFKVFKDGTQEICVSVGGTESCQPTTFPDNPIGLYSGLVGDSIIQIKVDKSEVKNLFQYEIRGDYTTLKEISPIYFNPGRYDSYYISTRCENNCVSSDINGATYKKHLGNLRTPLEVINKYFAQYNYLQIGSNKSSTIMDVEKGYKICKDDNCGGLEEAKKNLEIAIKKTYSYCQIIYSGYAKHRDIERIDECNSFINYYNKMIEQNIIGDLSEGCELISSELFQFLKWVLNVIKIAAPILVIILGSLDFIKVLFTGDPDKETKEAFKKFKNRLIAASLLFLIPVILQFCMNIFLDGQQGYDKENPFCDLG